MKHVPTNKRLSRVPVPVAVDGKLKLFKGRQAWTLARLAVAGARGCNPLNRPAPRWSDYVLRLRRQGVRIESVREPHEGPYAGTHVRYVLKSKVRWLAAGKAS